jgi:hypothetical protein
VSTIIGIVLLAFGVAGLIVCVIYHAGVLFFTVAFLLMLVGGVLVFDNGDPNGLKFPDVFRIFGGARGYIFRMNRLRAMVNQGLITEEEYEQRKKEYERKYGMKGGRQ